MSVIRNYHNYKLPTNLRHRDEEPQNNKSHKAPGRQTKFSNQLSHSTYLFIIIYTALPHRLSKFNKLLKQAFDIKGPLYLACNETHALLSYFGSVLLIKNACLYIFPVCLVNIRLNSHDSVVSKHKTLLLCCRSEDRLRCLFSMMHK